MIVMAYYNSGDLIRYISNDFYNINWETKLFRLRNIIFGLENIHNSDIIHRDLHSGNIFIGKNIYGNESTYVGDLGISKSATESTDNNENYGTGKRKIEDLVTDNNDGQCIKKEKLCENEINEYLTNEIKFDINMNFNQSHKPHNKDYVTLEFELDIDFNNP
ncbi:kinase-like domain-containing protein [Rhizophagus irregularis DAOM 181602=DAOM 197198]|nr:kinase-like domain-containing protein [Rhizophagus irregularis DAOM 181602=DAOM 197198]